MKRLLLATALTLATVTASAAEIRRDRWVLNDMNLPIVQEDSGSQFLANPTCDGNSLWLFDFDIEKSALGKSMSFKIRVDKREIREYKGAFYDHDGVPRMVINIDEGLAEDLFLGNTLRIQWPAQGGGTIVETYSLIGFTATYRTAVKDCGSDWDPANDYFQTSNGDEYFRS